MSALGARVETIIQEKGLLPAGEAVLVGVSGGVDSMVLLDLLHDLASTYRWRLLVAHYNHKYRGEESDQDAALVQLTAESLRLHCVVGLNDSIEPKGLSREMSARRWRHAFFARTARDQGINRIALAHHADDQLELFFLRLFRGTTTLGAAGMRWSNPSPAGHGLIIRPLLAERRSAILSYAQGRTIPYRLDASNFDRSFLRNRVRHDFLPWLRSEWGPSVEKNVLRTIGIMASEAEWMEQAVLNWSRNPGREAYARLPVAMQRQWLCRQLEQLGIAPTCKLIEKLHAAPGKRVPGPAGGHLERDSDGTIRIRSPENTQFDRWSESLRLKGSAGTFQVENGRVDWAILRQDPPAQIQAEPGLECFDAGKVGRKVTLRHWQPGDRFQPLGFPKPARLQDLFTNRKIPAERRRRLVVAAAGTGELFWVEGLPPSELFKLRPETTRRLRWAWRRNPGI